MQENAIFHCIMHSRQTNERLNASYQGLARQSPNKAFYWLLEPFSGVEIHMEMDIEWKWSGNGAQLVKIVWIGLDLGQSVDLKPYDDIEPSQNMIKVTQK